MAGEQRHKSVSIGGLSSNFKPWNVIGNKSSTDVTYTSCPLNTTSLLDQSSNKHTYSEPGCKHAEKTVVYGWRTRVLYTVVSILLALSVLNLCLIVWIIKVMDLNVDGMGRVKLRRDSVRMEANTEFTNTIKASRINSFREKPLVIQSHSNVTILAKNGDSQSRLSINSGVVQADTNFFVVRTPNGKNIFYGDKNGITIGVKRLKSTGSDGAVFKSSLQTPYIKSDSGQDLRIESQSQSVKISAPKGFDVLSTGGSIKLKSKLNIHLTSMEGSVIFDSDNVRFESLPISIPRVVDGKKYADVHQVCVCKDSGKLFLVPPDGKCRASMETCR